jgi:hypothetical protein
MAKKNTPAKSGRTQAQKAGKKATGVKAQKPAAGSGRVAGKKITGGKVTKLAPNTGRSISVMSSKMPFMLAFIEAWGNENVCSVQLVKHSADTNFPYCVLVFHAHEKMSAEINDFKTLKAAKEYMLPIIAAESMQQISAVDYVRDNLNDFLLIPEALRNIEGLRLRPLTEQSKTPANDVPAAEAPEVPAATNEAALPTQKRIARTFCGTPYEATEIATDYDALNRCVVLCVTDARPDVSQTYFIVRDDETIETAIDSAEAKMLFKEAVNSSQR